MSESVFSFQRFVPPPFLDPAQDQINKAARSIQAARDIANWGTSLRAALADLEEHDLVLKGGAGSVRGWITIHHEAPDEEGEMVTHIFVGGGGTVTKGPRSLIGSNIKHLPQVHSAVNGAGKAHKFHVGAPSAQEPAGARAQKNYGEHTPPKSAAQSAGESAVAGALARRGGGRPSAPKPAAEEGAPATAPGAPAKPGEDAGAPAAKPEASGPGSMPKAQSRQQSLANFEQHHRDNYVAKHGGDEGSLAGSGLDHDFFGSGTPHYAAPAQVPGSPAQPALAPAPNAQGGAVGGSGAMSPPQTPSTPSATPSAAPQVAGGQPSIPEAPFQAPAGAPAPAPATGGPPMGSPAQTAGTATPQAVAPQAGGEVSGSPAQTASGAQPPEADLHKHLLELTGQKAMLEEMAQRATDPNSRRFIQQALGAVTAEMGTLIAVNPNLARAGTPNPNSVGKPPIHVGHGNAPDIRFPRPPNPDGGANTDEQNPISPPGHLGRPPEGRTQAPGTPSAPVPAPDGDAQAAPEAEPQAAPAPEAAPEETPPVTAASPASPSTPAPAPTASPTPPHAPTQGHPATAPPAHPVPAQAGPTHAPAAPSTPPTTAPSSPPLNPEPAKEETPDDIAESARKAAHAKFLADLAKGGGTPNPRSGGGGAARGPRAAHAPGSTEPSDTDSHYAAAYKAALAHYRSLGHADLTDEDHAAARGKAQAVLSRRASRASGGGGGKSVKPAEPKTASAPATPAESPAPTASPPAPVAEETPVPTSETAPTPTSEETAAPGIAPVSTPDIAPPSAPEVAPTPAPMAEEAPIPAPLPEEAPPAEEPQVPPQEPVQPEAQPEAAPERTPNTIAAEHMNRIGALDPDQLGLDELHSHLQGIYNTHAGSPDAKTHPLTAAFRANTPNLQYYNGHAEIAGQYEQAHDELAAHPDFQQHPELPGALSQLKGKQTEHENEVTQPGANGLSTADYAKLERTGLKQLYLQRGRELDQPAPASDAAQAAAPSVEPKVVTQQPTPPTGAGDTSVGHVEHIGDHEYFHDPSGDLHRAPRSNSLDVNGYRQGSRFVSTKVMRDRALAQARSMAATSSDSDASPKSESTETPKAEPKEDPKVESETDTSAKPESISTSSPAPSRKELAAQAAAKATATVAPKVKEAKEAKTPGKSGRPPNSPEVKHIQGLNQKVEAIYTDLRRGHPKKGKDEPAVPYTADEKQAMQKQIDQYFAEITRIQGDTPKNENSARDLAKDDEYRALQEQREAEKSPEQLAEEQFLASPFAKAYAAAHRSITSLAAVDPALGGARHTAALQAHHAAMANLHQAFAASPPSPDRLARLHKTNSGGMADRHAKFVAHEDSEPTPTDDKYLNPNSSRSAYDYKKDRAAWQEVHAQRQRALTHHTALHEALGDMLKQQVGSMTSILPAHQTVTPATSAPGHVNSAEANHRGTVAAGLQSGKAVQQEELSDHLQPVFQHGNVRIEGPAVPQNAPQGEHLAAQRLVQHEAHQFAAGGPHSLMHVGSQGGVHTYAVNAAA